MRLFKWLYILHNYRAAHYCKVLSSDLDKFKKTAVECMKDYVEHSQFSTEEKEELKNNYEHWADVTLDGIKQRLRDSDKLLE